MEKKEKNEKIKLGEQFIDIFCPLLNKSLENPDNKGFEFEINDESGKPIIKVRLEGDAYKACRTEEGYTNICTNLAWMFVEGFLSRHNLN